MADLMAEVSAFRKWADALAQEHRIGEWELDYDCWPALYAAVLEIVDKRPFKTWQRAEVQAVLYALARDNELEYLSGEIRERNAETLLSLASAATQDGEVDAKWQLASELGRLDEMNSEAERLLFELIHDDNEYVRRRSLEALAKLGSTAVEELALASWNESHEHQEWSRMMALWCLRRVDSPRLDELIEAAEADDRPHLSEFARTMRRGELES